MIKKLELTLNIKHQLNYRQLDELVKKYQKRFDNSKSRFVNEELKADKIEFWLFKLIQFHQANNKKIIKKSKWNLTELQNILKRFNDYRETHAKILQRLALKLTEAQDIIDQDYLLFFQKQQDNIIANKVAQLEAIKEMIDHNEQNPDELKSIKQLSFSKYQLEKFSYKVKDDFYQLMLEKLIVIDRLFKSLLKEQQAIKSYIEMTNPTVSFVKRYLKKSRFDFEFFEQNVLYKEINGQRHKIVADIKDLELHFVNPAVPGQKNKVLRNTSIDFLEGKVHAIIGESGSGKSVITSLLYGLTGENARIDRGTVKLYNHEIQDFNFKRWEKSKYRGTIVSAVFQNPMSTLNPTMKIGKQIMEGMLINKLVKSRREAKQKAIEYLEMTKINNANEIINLYPHELSGGMIQRVVIASIIALQPKIIVLDEPTTALDPTVQALVLDIIRELQQKLKLTIVFITHDLGVVASISDYIAIMYAGQIIEEGTRDEILLNSRHPYTWGLITSMPDINKGSRLSTIRGSVPSSLNDIKGDAFAVRNDYALGRDFEFEPEFYWLSETHRVKSALLDKQAPKFDAPEIIQNNWKIFKKGSHAQTSK